jgi:hypothetical protein
MVADDHVGAAVNDFHNAIMDHRGDGEMLRNLSNLWNPFPCRTMSQLFPLVSMGYKEGRQVRAT